MTRAAVPVVVAVVVAIAHRVGVMVRALVTVVVMLVGKVVVLALAPSSLTSFYEFQSSPNTSNDCSYSRHRWCFAMVLAIIVVGYATYR